MTLQPLEIPSTNFDPQRRAASRELKAAIKTIVKRLLAVEASLAKRQRRRTPENADKFALAVEVIVCNLLVLRLLDPRRVLAVPRQNGMMWATGRYHNEVYGKAFVTALDLLALGDKPFIEVVAKGFRYSKKNSQKTTVRPLPTMIFLAGPSARDLKAFRRIPSEEVVILKAEKNGEGDKTPLEYPDTPLTRRYRREVKALNEWFAKAPIFFDLEKARLANLDAKNLVDPTRLEVVRVFNNGKWTEGGRLFGGFWETLRREDRFRYLRIGSQACPDGEPVANVDYGQLFARLAYRKANCEPPEGDLYHLPGFEAARAGIKQMFGSMLFSKTGLKTWPNDTYELFAPGTHFSDVIAAIKSAHAPVSHLFGTGLGFSCMFEESCLLLNALTILRARDVVALPLHDSVLVAGSEAEGVKQVLEEVALSASLPFSAVVKIDYAIESNR